MIELLDDLIQLYEAQVPAHPEDPRYFKHTAMIERILRSYFTALEVSFPYSRIERIYNTYVKESASSEAGDAIDNLLTSFDAVLQVELQGALVPLYLEGQAEMISWGKTKAGIPILYEGPPQRAAVEWARKHAATLVTNMDTVSKDRIARVVADGIGNKRGVPGIARDIRSVFSDMSKYRSALIAKTETRQTLFATSQASMDDMKIEGKQWVLGAGGKSGNCELCIANADAGVIPVDAEFPNPQDTIHPGCTCGIAPARMPGKKDYVG